VSSSEFVDDRGSLRSGEAKLARRIHQDPIPRQKVVKVTTQSVLGDANRADNLAKER